MHPINYTLWPEVLIAAGTFVLSVGSSMFIAGQRWGEVRSEMRYMNDRLARLEGMFILTPKDGKDGTRSSD